MKIHPTTEKVPPNIDSVKRRGRPLSFDRDHVLEQAMLLFWQYGYEATSISDLVHVMGISAPSVYAAFGDKEQLFMTCVERYKVTNGCALRKIMDTAPTAKIAIENYLQANAASLSKPDLPHGCMIVTAATNCSQNSTSVQEALLEERAEVLKLLTERIERGVQQKDTPDASQPEVLARFYATVVQGMSVQARDGANRNELQDVAKAAMMAWPS